jgi:hypothetical protein
LASIAGGGFFWYWHRYHSHKAPVASKKGLAQVIQENAAKTAEGRARLQLAAALQALAAKNYSQAIQLATSARGDLKGDDLISSYGIEAQAYGKENKLDQVERVAQEAIQLSGLANNQAAKQTWESILSQAKAGKNPYTQTVSDKDANL